MKLWAKNALEAPVDRGVACAANSDAPREEWMREAIQRIAASAGAERIGVWLEANPAEDAAAYGQFRGIVWDRQAAEIPPEWCQLSPEEAPLPPEVLTATGSVELDPEASPAQTMVGPLLELRRALWVPVQTQQRLRGLLLVGTKRKAVSLPRASAEQVAAELAIALERDEARQNDQDSRADTRLARQVLRSLASGVSAETVLQQLAESCATELGGAVRHGAVFAAIGVVENAPVQQDTACSPAGTVSFPWTAGERGIANALQDGPLLESWRAAIANRRIAGNEFRGIPSQAWPGRAVAVPLESCGQPLGVLVAVLAGVTASLAALERIELRASLAAQALAHRAEAQRRASRGSAWRSATRSSSQAALLLDAKGMVLECSPAAADLLLGPHPSPSLSKTKKTNRLFSRLFHLSEQERASSWLQRQMVSVAATQTGSTAEILEAKLANGRPVRVRHLFSGADAALLLIEKIHAPESALASHTAETEWHSVIEWLEEGVVLFDAWDQVHAMNMRFEQMVGLAAEESGRYRTLKALIARLEVHAADPPAFAERWRSLARGIKGGVREELQMTQPIPRILERWARPIFDGVGRLLGRVEIYRDLTAQRIFQSKLLQTEKLAALGQMLTGVAHELSNPLTTILGYAQRLLTRKDAGGQSEEARQICQEAERAGRILRQLLSHARETPPERHSFSLNQVVLRAMELQRFGLAAEKIRPELDLDPVLPMVHGDAGQLQQVLMNLVGNARQAIEQQGSGGTIRVRSRHAAEGRVTLSVEDTGPGIPAAILGRVFDPFFTTKPTGVGTGLGLSIVQSIVREHGGCVRVTSPPDGGACFTIDLPALAMPARISHEPEPPALKHSPLLPAEGIVSAAGTVAAQRILVVEDEPTVARLIADVLEDEGFEVTVLLDGREALERTLRESFDLVICDIKMPGLDGQHLYKSLKRAGGPLDNRFLFVTGDTIGPHTQAFLKQHRLPYLSKPFRMEELSDHVRRTLNSPRSAARPAVATKKTAARNGCSHAEK